MTDFVPVDFEVPRTLDGPGFRLEPLGPEHNERDHEAWMSSIDHIRATPGYPDGKWPYEMPLSKNLTDLERHARHFKERVGFTYSVLEGDDVIGCVYIYPSESPDHDADVSSWVRASRADLDETLWLTVTDWLSASWPFSNPDYSPRG